LNSITGPDQGRVRDAELDRDPVAPLDHLPECEPAPISVMLSE
jgi:hypothetical protein